MTADISPGDQLANAALAFVGVPFRLHGRDPLANLDCVGLVSASLAAIERPAAAPSGYGLRNLSISAWLPAIEAAGFIPANGDLTRGDLVLVSPGAGQTHFAIADFSPWFIHAHAGLKRVVREPIRIAAPPQGHWRLT
ncbi:MAG: NlpC/P60 family protein [Erythrobacter sp.]|nr:NlpC/P60 family protein [Erythrobacter sp.]